MAKKEKYWIATSNFWGDMGKIKKGEIFSHEGDSEENDEYVFMYLANPGFEFYTDIYKPDLTKFFRPIDRMKDKREMEKLNKWGLVEFGDKWWVTSVSLDGAKNNTIKRAIASALNRPNDDYGHIQKSAKSPKLAIKQAGHQSGRMDDVGRDAFFSKMYAGWGFLVTKKDPKELGVTKLTNMVKKAGTLKEGLLSDFDNFVNESEELLNEKFIGHYETENWDLFVDTNLVQKVTGSLGLKHIGMGDFKTTKPVETDYGDVYLEFMRVGTKYPNFAGRSHLVKILDDKHNRIDNIKIGQGVIKDLIKYFKSNDLVESISSDDFVNENWKIGDTIKYKSLKTGKWRKRKIQKKLGNGKWELDSGAIAYEKDPDFIKESDEFVNETSFGSEDIQSLFSATKSQILDYFGPVADKFNPVPLVSDHHDEMYIHVNIHETNSTLISFSKGKRDDGDRYGFTVQFALAFNTVGGYGGIGVAIGYKDGTYYGAPFNTEEGGFFKRKRSDWWDKKSTIESSQKLEVVMSALKKWFEKWMPVVIKNVQSGKGHYWEKIPSYK